MSGLVKTSKGYINPQLVTYISNLSAPKAGELRSFRVYFSDNEPLKFTAKTSQTSDNEALEKEYSELVRGIAGRLPDERF